MTIPASNLTEAANSFHELNSVSLIPLKDNKFPNV